MQLRVTRDFEYNRLQLVLELTVQDRRAIHNRGLLTHDLFEGHTVADLELGSTIHCPSAGEMLTAENAVRAQLLTLKRYMADDAGKEETIDFDPPSPKEPAVAEVPDHIHPAYEPPTGFFANWGELVLIAGILVWVGLLMWDLFHTQSRITAAFKQLGVTVDLDHF